MSEFEQRAAQNEVLFRSVNEAIEKLGREAAQRHVEFVCECSNGACVEQIPLEIAEYEEVRSEGRWFAIVPGHVADEIEHIVRKNDRYWIVEKDTPAAAELAELMDPRD